MALSQAAFAGIPIISSNLVGAVDDYVKDGFNGIIVNSDSVNDFVNAVFTIKENKVFLENAKKIAKEYVSLRSVEWGCSQLECALKVALDDPAGVESINKM